MGGLAASPGLGVSRPEDVPSPHDYVGHVTGYLGRSVGELFEARAKSHPDRAAVVTAEGDSLSYGRLDELGDRVGAALTDLLGPGNQPVVLAIDGALPLAAAILGCIKAGKVHIPLPPGEPSDRRAGLLDHARPALIVVEEEGGFSEEATGGAKVLALEELSSAPASSDSLPPVAPDAGLRILYTSGSTGRPKGVFQTHAQLLAYLKVKTGFLRLAPSDRFALLTSLAFGAGTHPFYGTLLEGGTVCAYDVKRRGLSGLGPWLERQGVTVWKGVPAVFRAFAESLPADCSMEAIRAVSLGADRILPVDVELFRAKFPEESVMVCMLAASEAGVIAQWAIDRHTAVDVPVPVGYPAEGAEVLVLDDDGDPVEQGEVGEIFVGGPQITEGYWNDPELTAEAFVLHPSGAGRLFRTGDLGRLRNDGLLEHLGRRDMRIKIRGYGVDLVEVENALLRVKGVKAAVAAGRPDASGETRLVAHIVAEEGTDLRPSSLRPLLESSLPDYMVPSLIVPLAELPTTARGKVDREALPDPDTLEGGTEVAEPRTHLERRLVEIWERVLERRPIGVRDDFFDLGGASIQAYQVIADINRELGIDLAATSFLHASTVEAQAALIERGEGRSVGALVPFRTSGSKEPFYCVHGRGGGVMFLRDLVPHLDPERPVWGIQPASREGELPPLRSVEQMAADYLEEVRALQPHGPYYLGGSCFGGLVAREMARLLDDSGEEVAALVLIDPPTPSVPKPRLPGRAWRAIRYRVKKRLTRRLRKQFPNHWRRRVEEIGRDRYSHYRRIHGKARDRYVPRPSRAPVVILASRGSRRRQLRMWRDVSLGGLEIQAFPGSHLDMFLPPRARLIAGMIQEALDRAERARSS